MYQRFSLVRSTGKKRLKRSEPLLLEFWIVILSLFVLFFQCGHSWAFWRAAKHDPTRVVSTTKQTNVFLFSPTQKIDHVPWPTARAQLCETTQMLRASLQPHTKMIVAPCVHQTRLCKHKLATFRRRRHAPEFPGFWGGLGHKCRRDPLTRWRCRRSAS